MGYREQDQRKAQQPSVGVYTVTGVELLSDDTVAASPRRRGPAIRRNRNGLQLLMTFEFVLGTALTYFGALQVWHENAVQSWPAVSGRIQDTKVAWDSVGVLTSKSGSSTQHANRLHVRYTYLVGGTEYTGTEIGFPSHNRSASADQKRYQVGNAVTVHYDPSIPTEALLDTSRSWSSVASMVIGLLLLGGAFRARTRLMQLHRRVI